MKKQEIERIKKEMLGWTKPESTLKKITFWLLFPFGWIFLAFIALLLWVSNIFIEEK